MTLKLIQADAFTNRVFGGNPAAVVPLEAWLPDTVLQQIATENNLSETAYIVPTANGFHLRWFTPYTEVRLCGHATLATAHVLWQHLGYAKEVIEFDSLSGVLKVSRTGDLYTLDFPTDKLEAGDARAVGIISQVLGVEPIEIWRGRDDFMAVLPSEAHVAALEPNFGLLKTLGSRGLIATAKGDTYDFVSRCFFPEAGVEEDPVTGSAHTTMTPYWAEKLGKTVLKARQISARGGDVLCDLRGERVFLSGSAVTYMIGEIYV